MLDRIAIASPCTADWNAMTGDARSRFCGQCRLHVHDLSAMTTVEAEALLLAAGKGRLCVRFHRRADGRVLTQDCPVGLRQKVRRAWARSVAAVCALWASAVACVRPGATSPVPQPSAQGEPVETVMGDVLPPEPAKTPVPAVTQPGGAVGPQTPLPGGAGVRPAGRGN